MHRGITPTCSTKDTLNLQVNGAAYIRQLKHGFPVHKLGAAAAASPVEVNWGPIFRGLYGGCMMVLKTSSSSPGGRG